MSVFQKKFENRWIAERFSHKIRVGAAIVRCGLKSGKLDRTEKTGVVE